ncbi:MAG: hydantoinase/oxoprolinase family protein [Pseudomonadota bacterium]
MTSILGLDIGGAHLKAAAFQEGRLMETRQIACPLWQGEDKLDTALAAISDLKTDGAPIAVTMTAELSDLFDTRQEGVRWIIARLDREFPAQTLHIWTSNGIFVSPHEARDVPDTIASMNYLATAHFAAHHVPDGIMIDMGTTTTDLIPLIDSRPVLSGTSDAQRLANSELVYTGLTRTAVMAVADQVPFKGLMVPLCREYFATMADVQRILGTLAEGIDVQATADGRGQSVEESIARLARMLGCDADDATNSEWTLVARHVARAQLSPVAEALGVLLSRTPALADKPIITTGCAHTQLNEFALREGFEPRPFHTLFRDTIPNATDINTCATAASVAALLATHLKSGV